MKGKTPAGVDFIRTTLDSFSVVSPEVTLTGMAFPIICCLAYSSVVGLASADFPAGREVLQFYIDVDTLNQKEGQKVRAYAEVWGTDETGLEYVPIAWIQSMV